MTKPSWQDFGTHDESAYPELWDGVAFAAAPCLGPTGLRLHDHSRRVNWGTLTNLVPSTDYVVQSGQYALRFDGANKSVQFSSLPLVTFARSFSMSCWVRNITTPNSDGSPFSYRLSPMIWIDGGTVKAFWNGVKASGSTTVTSRSAWSMLSIAWTGSRAEVYVDGRLDGSGATTSAPVPDVLPFAIGLYAESPLRNVAGDVDDAVIWSRSLSPNEWRQLYQLGRGGMYQRRRRRAIYLPQAGFQAAWARGSNVMLGFNQP
jgi:hypothetical protein